MSAASGRRPASTKGTRIVSVLTAPVPVRLDPDTLEQIDAIAAADDRPRSYIVRRLVLEALAARDPKDGATPDPA